MSRLQDVVKNSFWGIISKILSLILGFVSRTVFIYYLGKELLGINGLYTEILNMISLAELGFGSALNFALYKPIAENDETKIIQLLSFYRKVYLIIILVMTFIGLALIPALPFIVKGAQGITLFELRLYYLIFLANAIFAYFLKYKYNYVNACRKDYVTTNIDSVINAVMVVAQILIIILTKNFLAYLIVHNGTLIASKLFISIYLNRKYPILKKKAEIPLEKKDRKVIFKDVKGLVVQQFAGLAIHSTDNIIISSLTGLGVVAVGLISNYNMLINSVLGFVTILFSSAISSFGNLATEKSADNYRNAFLQMNFLNAWLYGFCCIAFWVLIPPFIQLWLGKEFLVDNISYFLIVLNCYLMGQTTIYHNARVAKGDFNKDKWLFLAQAIINLVVSIIGAYYLGLVGVYIGTVVSRLFAMLRPILTYKFMMNRSSKEYYFKFFIYLIIALLLGGATYILSQMILKVISIGTFILACLIVAILPNVGFALIYFKTKEFKGVFNRIKRFFKKN